MFNNKTILLTGTAGFIGSNFVPYFLEKYPDYNLINLDLLTYAGNLENLKECEANPRYKFIKGDICNRELLDVAYKKWMDSPFKYKEHFLGTDALASVKSEVKTSLPRFHHISTDEVYGTLGESGLFTELTPYAPNSPYSASKASSDMIVRAYNETYGMNTVITNCSNNYGPKQHDEKLIPTIIRNALKGNPIPIYGDGKNIRDWLFVLDHCKGIDLVFHKGKSGETYNIGGRNERTNLQIVDRICEILDKEVPLNGSEVLTSPNKADVKTSVPNIKSYKELITFVQDRAGHDRRYAIDATKLEDELLWRADENFDSGIVKTVEWYLKKYKFLEKKL